jgi:hypothetical protein
VPAIQPEKQWAEARAVTVSVGKMLGPVAPATSDACTSR